MRLAFLCYVALTATATAFHEPWRDEAQAWLLARDLPLGELLSHIHYEGSPALWHVLIYPFAASGLPIFWMQVVHLGIAIAIAAVVLFKSSFSPKLRIAFVFSYFMLWEYAVIARSYSLSILLLFLIAWQYGNRHTSPLQFVVLLALLVNTNVHSIFPAAALSLVYVYEVLSTKARSRYLLAGLVLITGIAVSIWQLIPSPDTTNQGLVHLFSWRAPFIALANAFFPEVPRTAYVTIGLALAISGIHISLLYKRSKQTAFILFLSYAGLFYLFAFKHTGSVRHHGFLMILLMVAYWIAPRNGDTSWSRLGEWALIGCFVLSSFFAAWNYVHEYKYPFSGAKAAAQFVQAPRYAGHTLIGHPSIKASSLAPYLKDRMIWYPDIEDFRSYITWNTAYEEGKKMSADEAIGRAREAFSDSNLLYILDQPLADSLVREYGLVYTSPETVFGYGEERYYLYGLRNPD